MMARSDGVPSRVTRMVSYMSFVSGLPIPQRDKILFPGTCSPTAAKAAIILRPLRRASSRASSKQFATGLFKANLKQRLFKQHRNEAKAKVVGILSPRWG